MFCLIQLGQGRILGDQKGIIVTIVIEECHGGGGGEDGEDGALWARIEKNTE